MADGRRGQKGGASARAISPGRRRLFALVTLATLAAGQELLFRRLFPVPELNGFNRMRYQMLAGSNTELRDARARGLVYDRLRFRSEPDGFDEVHALNRYGFRGPDFSVDPPRGRRRVLVIGDSVVEGQGAPASATIPAELDRLARSASVPAEFLNLGVVAATLGHAATLARDAIPLLKPTDVVLLVYANDLPAPPFPPVLDGPPPSFARRNSPVWVPRAAELMQRLATGQPVYRRWPHAPVDFFPAVPSPQNPWTRQRERPPNLDESLYRAMAAGRINPWLYEQAQAIPGMLAHDFAQGGSPGVYLLRLRDWCRAAGARLVVVYVPFCGVTHPRYAPALVKAGMDAPTAARLATDPAYRRQGAALAAVCGELGVPLADATDALVAAEAAGTPQFWEFDSHPRPAGYATVARRIFESWRAAPGS